MLRRFLDWLRKPVLLGVKGETLGPRETIIPPKGGSGTSSGNEGHDDLRASLKELSKVRNKR